jgi:hypothetical protein
LLGLAADHATSQSKNQMFGSICTSPKMALLWQHANNSPRECSDSMITYVGTSSILANMTICALRSILPAYVAICDAKAIQCEELTLATDNEAKSCQQMIESNGPCSFECSLYSQKMSTGSKCLENVMSIREVLANVVNQTCADSGKHALMFFIFFMSVCNETKICMTFFVWNMRNAPQLHLSAHIPQGRHGRCLFPQLIRNATLQFRFPWT